MQQFLEFVIRQLTDRPAEVAVGLSMHNAGEHRYTLDLPASEVGKVIGKQGHTIRAIRGLLISAEARHGVTATVEILERIET